MSGSASTQDDRLTPLQVLALTEELESATKLIDLGVTELHRLSLANDFYHLPMQLLAQGLERFLKLTYAMAELGDSGALPTAKTMKSLGHDIAAIADALIGRIERHEACVGGEVQDDLEFIRSDPDLRRVLALLTEFGNRGRYHRLDEFLDPESADGDSDPCRRWQAFELEIAQRRPDWLDALGTHQRATELQREASAHIASLIDRFSRAIARMWTIGPLPEEARRYTGLVSRFVALRDEDLGVPR